MSNVITTDKDYKQWVGELDSTHSACLHLYKRGEKGMYALTEKDEKDKGRFSTPPTVRLLPWRR